MEINKKLRELQLCELEVLKEFVRVCEQLGLRYYLVGGTLLGAVRHGGFIPWDDDIDVAMPREDYDRFAVLAPPLLGQEYFCQDNKMDGEYYLSYAKIRKKGTFVYEERFKDSRFEKGVFIDIFPLDDCPKPGIVCHFLFNVLAVMNYRGEVDSGVPYDPYSEWSGKIGYALLQLLRRDDIPKLRRKLLRLSKRLGNGQYVASYSGAYGYRKEVLPWEWYQETARLVFEGQEYAAPKGFASILARSYGANYMELPSVKNRRWHIDLDKSVIKREDERA